MSLDDLQQTWQSQPSSRLRIEPELLLRELRHNQRSFKRTIFWRDFREVFVAAAVAVLFIWDGLSGHGWPWVLLGGTCIWVGGFILVDRFRRRGRSARFGDSLLGCVEASLEDVEHQIWLLKNVLWWYILPPAVGMLIVFVHSTMNMEEASSLRWAVFAATVTFCGLVCAGVYWVNQYAVRASLEPRRQELLAVRESLMKGDE
ncbi:MAG: hypothetical protein L0228_07945 [Planctomycetes bacterium]|nr:hypothetical protein [Planctomycetota bacterium]